MRGYKRDKDKRKLDFGQGKQADSVFQKRVYYFLNKRIVILENRGRKEMGLVRKEHVRQEDRLSRACVKLADSKGVKSAQ